MKTLLFLGNGFEEIEAIGTADILRRGEIDVQIVSVEQEKCVVGKHKIPVTADIMFDEIELTDVEMLIVPGGPGVANLKKHEGLKALLKKYVNEGKKVSAICAAPTILGELGLLEGKKAICYPGLEGELKGAVIQNSERVVHDGNIITSKGPGTTFAFALQIVQVLKGHEKAREVAKHMVL